MPFDKTKTTDNTQPLTPEKMRAWNQFSSYLKTQGLAGSTKLNNIPYSKKVMGDYLKQNPDANLSYDDVVPVQKGIQNYRDYTINLFKTDPQHHIPPQGLSPDYSNYMQWATGTGQDGINGQYTSQFQFPESYMYVSPTTTQDLGLATAQK